MTSATTADLVRSLLGMQHLPSALQEQVQRVTMGNTFFVQELIRSLIEGQEALRRVPGGWQVDESALSHLALPTTIQQAIVRRLAHLPQPARRVLQIAAVIGPTFWDGAVSQIGQLPLEQVQSALHHLLDMDLIMEQATSTLGQEREYRIQHVTVCDVAYEDTPLQRRKRYHKRAADWFVARWGDRAAEIAGQIAGHYEQAGAFVPASEWYARAGHHALETYAPETAVQYYHQALALMSDAEPSAQQTAIYEGLGRAYLNQARFAEALEAYTTMRSVAEAHGDLVAQARAYIGRSYMQAAQGDFEAALASIERALHLSQVGAEPSLECVQALLGKGWILRRLNRAAEALPWAEQAWEYSQALHNSVLMVRSLLLLGGIHSALGHPERATRAHERALTLCHELGEVTCLSVVYNNLGVIAEDRGAYQTAADYYRKAVDLARETKRHDGELLYLNNLGGVLVRLGKHRAAVEVLRDVIQRQKDTRWFALAHTYCALAEATLAQEQPEAALPLAQQALTLATKTGQRLHLGTTWRVLGLIAAHLQTPIRIEDQPLDAAACFAISLRLLTKVGAEQERQLTLQSWAQHGSLPLTPPSHHHRSRTSPLSAPDAEKVLT